MKKKKTRKAKQKRKRMVKKKSRKAKQKRQEEDGKSNYPLRV